MSIYWNPKVSLPFGIRLLFLFVCDREEREYIVKMGWYRNPRKATEGFIVPWIGFSCGYDLLRQFRATMVGFGFGQWTTYRHIGERVHEWIWLR